MEDKVVAYRSDRSGVEFVFPVRDGQGWVSRAQMVEMFDIDSRQVHRCVRYIFADGKLSKAEHVRKMYTLKIEPNVRKTRETRRLIVYYSFSVAQSVGFRSRSKSAIDFDRWVKSIVHEIPQIDSKPSAETVDLRAPLVKFSAIDSVFEKWIRKTQEVTESNQLCPDLYSSIYDSAATRCLKLLKKSRGGE